MLKQLLSFIIIEPMFKMWLILYLVFTIFRSKWELDSQYFRQGKRVQIRIPTWIYTFTQISFLKLKIHTHESPNKQQSHCLQCEFHKYGISRLLHLCSELVLKPKQLQIGQWYRVNQGQFINHSWNVASFPLLTHLLKQRLPPIPGTVYTTQPIQLEAL